MKKTFATLFTPVALVAMFALCAFTQSVSAQCPKISVNAPYDDVTAGTPITFSVNVSGGDRNVHLTPSWTISAAVISVGQGTSAITVDTTGTGGQSITATVELGGLDPKCARTSSATAYVKDVAKKAKKIDEYSSLISKENEYLRLDNAATQLQKEPGGNLYVISYGGKMSRPGASVAASNRVKDYLVVTRDIDVGRIVTIDGGKRDKPTIEIWLVPIGADPPEPTPSVVPSTVTPPKKKP